MAKITLARHFSKLSTFLSSLLLLVCLTMSPVYADSGSNADKIDKAINMIRTHMESIKQNNPAITGMDEKARQTEEQLRAGTISVKESCFNCHTESGRNPAGR